MDIDQEVKLSLDHIQQDVDEIYNLLLRPPGAGRSRQKTIAAIDDIELRCRALRASLIRASRVLGHGIRQNGQPDMRFNQNRTLGSFPTNGQAVAPPLGRTRNGMPDLRYGKSKR